MRKNEETTPTQRDHLARLASHAAGVAADRIKARLEEEAMPEINAAYRKAREDMGNE